jgi:hypothetical protein
VEAAVVVVVEQVAVAAVEKTTTNVLQKNRTLRTSQRL